MIMQSTEILFEFSNLMLTFWNDYNVLVWNLNKKFTSFVGAELLLFITNTEKIITFIECKFCKTNTRDDLCNSLRLWYQISPFLVITTIKDVEKYETTRKQFLLDLKQFYTIGGRSFLTKKATTGHVGNDEKFYMHVLRFYIPRIADETFEKYNLGVGIFTMQGFERCNKESKNTMRRFSNRIVNIIVGNLKRLWNIYFSGSTKV